MTDYGAAEALMFFANKADKKIERIKRDFRDCRNELCLRCGEYKMRHKGACDGCRWKDYEE